VDAKMQVTGKIKVAYTMDVLPRNSATSPDTSPAKTPYAGGGMSVGGGFGALNMNSSLASGGGIGGVRRGSLGSPAGVGAGVGAAGGGGHNNNNITMSQSYPQDMGDDSYYDELVEPDPRKEVEFPFNVHIIEMSTLDLTHVHQFARNQPYIKAFCDTFYSETKVFWSIMCP
jgi:hypothetical protein